MADTAAEAAPAPRPARLMKITLGAFLALAGAGGGYFVVYSGILPTGAHAPAHSVEQQSAGVSFVPVDPVIVSLGSASTSRFLTFRAQLEVPSTEAASVTALLPRVVDVLNSYLRAVDVREFEDPSALIRLRAQMLRRVQMVAGEGRVTDLLVMEFVLN